MSARVDFSAVPSIEDLWRTLARVERACAQDMRRMHRRRLEPLIAAAESRASAFEALADEAAQPFEIGAYGELREIGPWTWRDELRDVWRRVRNRPRRA